MNRLKLFTTALALAWVVCAVPAQSVVNTNFASVNKVIPDGQASGASDTHVLHFYRNGPFSLNGTGQLTGTWAPDGRQADPASVTEAAWPTSLLGSFNGTDPNGSWTLFLADLDFGQQSTLVNWGLVISAVPEPASIGFVGTGALVLGASLIRRRK